jgi:hypothetical protein
MLHFNIMSNMSDQNYVIKRIRLFVLKNLFTLNIWLYKRISLFHMKKWYCKWIPQIFEKKNKHFLHKTKIHKTKKLQSPKKRWLIISSSFFTSYIDDFTIQYMIILQSQFKYSIIVTNNYFRKVTLHFKNITFITPKSKVGRRKKVDIQLVSFIFFLLWINI